MLLAVSDIASWFAQPFVCDNNIHCVNNRTQSVNGHTGAVATMTAVLTAGERLHKTPEETVSFLQSGILLGRVGEGTPDAAYVMIDLRETEDGFVPQQRENDAVVESGDVRVGMLPWWYWQPWWWWWWTPRGRRGRGRVRMRMRMDGSADFEDIDADIRIGIREREDPSDRFELGVIELSIDGSNTPFHVTSAVMGEEDMSAIGKKWTQEDEVDYPTEIGVASSDDPAEFLALLGEWVDISDGNATALVHTTTNQRATGFSLTLSTRSNDDTIYEVNLTLRGAESVMLFANRLLYTATDINGIKKLDDILATYGTRDVPGTPRSATATEDGGAKAMAIISALVDTAGAFVHRLARGKWTFTLRAKGSMIKPARTGAKLLPRVLRRRRKAKSGVMWRDVYIDSVVKVSVKEENAKQHPWAGDGYRDKYAFTFDGPGGNRVLNAQGVRFVVESGKNYVFDASKVPKKHPFYFTTNPTGGQGADDSGRMTPSAHKAQHRIIGFNPTSIVDAFYQCESHEKMGGPVRVVGSGMTPALVYDDADGSAIMYGEQTGQFYVDGDWEFTTLDKAFAAVGLEMFAVQNIGKSIAPAHDGLAIAHVGEHHDEYDADSPAVIIKKDGSLFCARHVHALGDLQEWLVCGKPRASGQLCPTCFT